jgi:hypothetical protein
MGYSGPELTGFIFPTATAYCALATASGLLTPPSLRPLIGEDVSKENIILSNKEYIGRFKKMPTPPIAIF